jgi:hypothetical protein
VHRSSNDACNVATWAWKPARNIREKVVGLDLPRKQQLIGAFIEVGRRADWGVERKADGTLRFKYYTDIAHLHNLADGLPIWITSIPAGEDDRKRAYKAVWDHAISKLVDVSLITCRFICIVTLTAACRNDGMVVPIPYQSKRMITLLYEDAIHVWFAKESDITEGWQGYDPGYPAGPAAPANGAENGGGGGPEMPNDHAGVALGTVCLGSNSS